MSDTEHVDRQRAFYDTRDHAHLQASADDAFARKLASEVANEVGIGPSHRILEIGAGFGRFTFNLLEHCDSLLAVDLSQVALDKLESQRDAAGLEARRCQTLCCDLNELTPEAIGGRFDFIVGFFLLHHLPDYAHSIRTLAHLLAPGGRMAIVEPNRRNPLYVVQLSACPDMTWAEEKGLFALSRKGVETACDSGSLEEIQTRMFGFFPPGIFNRFGWARSLEAMLEKSRVVQWILPFLLLTARAPIEDEGRP